MRKEDPAKILLIQVLKKFFDLSEAPISNEKISNDFSLNTTLGIVVICVQLYQTYA